MLMINFKQIKAKIIDESFFIYQLLKLRLSNNSRLKILFSKKKAWESKIIRGFKFTQHQISFAELSTENFADYDLVVPLTVDDLVRLSSKTLNKSKKQLPIPSRESIELCDDKYRFNKAMVDNGFGDYIPQMGGALSYPYILKKRIDEWAQNCFIIFDEQQEQGFLDKINHSDYFCQQLIHGTKEYATHILIKDKKILHSLNIEYGFKSELPIKGKEKILYNNICHCPYLKLFTEVLNSINFEGLCCVNYKVVDARPQILEINPRFGGSLSRFFFSFIKYL